MGSFAYGAARNLIYAPKMKDTDYITDRIGVFCIYTAATPLLCLAYLLVDLKNIERVVRKMPGPIDRRPW